MSLSRFLLVGSISAFLLTACAVGGTGSSVDDDDGDDSGPSSGNGSFSGSNGSGTGGSGGATGSGGAGGTTGAGDTGGSTTTGGGTCQTTTLTWNDPVCGACMDTSCCSSVQACDASTNCLDFIGCIQTCTDQLCQDACVEGNPSGYNEFLTVDNCMQTSCPTECAAP